MRGTTIGGNLYLPVINKLLMERPVIFLCRMMKVATVYQGENKHFEILFQLVDHPIMHHSCVLPMYHDNGLNQKDAIYLIDVGGKRVTLKVQQIPVALLGIAVSHPVCAQYTAHLIYIKILVQFRHKQPPINRWVQSSQQQTVIPACVLPYYRRRGKSP